MDAESNGEKSTTFRWINVARYAVASVMTVLIAVVVVIAIKTVLRPDTLIVEVVGGSISVELQPPNQLQLVLDLYFYNPSGRAVMYYYNVTGYLFDKNISASTSRNPSNDSFFSTFIEEKALVQQEQTHSFTECPAGPDSMAPSYFDMLYHDRSARIHDVTMRLEGNLVTESFSGYNTTARWTQYYCSPLVVGWAPAPNRGGQDDEANKNRQGSVFCTAARN